jgi:transporter family protein
MKPQLFALLTAVAWGVGGYFEKKGLHAGQLAPQVGITVRTAVALLVLATVSFPQWHSLTRASARSLVMLVVGGGLVAGSLGMLCFYVAIKGAPLSRVMPIAFTAPLFGALMGICVGGEPLSWKTAVGVALTVGGIVVLTVG